MTASSLEKPARIPVRVVRIEYACSDISLYELRSQKAGRMLPFSAGAHIDLLLENGLLRQYSLVNSQDEQHRYVIAVKRDPQSRGGSSYIHDKMRAGDVIHISEPRNNFPLREDADESIFIAGGIGITPIVCMTRRLASLKRSWKLYYSVRKREDAVFLDMFERDHLHLHIDEERGGGLLDIAEIVNASGNQSAHLYCCGPSRMVDSFELATKHLPAQLVHLERFAAPAFSGSTESFVVELARSGRRVHVLPNQTILAALKTSGVHVESSCEQGICGTCMTRVLAGTPDHRDSLLSDDEKAANDRMMICCSRSLSELIVLDL